MFQSIAFYIGEKTLDLNGQAYPLGELTAEVLNISPDEYHKLHRMLAKAVCKMVNYEKSHQMQDWFDANEQMIELHRSLVRHRVFQLLQETEEILSEARVLTEQYSLFQEPEDLEPTERDLESTRTIWSIRRSMAATIFLGPRWRTGIMRSGHLTLPFRRSLRKKPERFWFGQGT